MREDSVAETSGGLFGQTSFQISDAFNTYLGLRYDYFQVDVDSNIAANSGTADKGRPNLKAGATYLSPFIGRIDDINWDGMSLIKEIAEIYTTQKFHTEILAASIRSSRQIVESAKAGAHVVTCPLSAILGLLKHPLTDIGLAQFLSDHQKAQK